MLNTPSTIVARGGAGLGIDGIRPEFNASGLVQAPCSTHQPQTRPRPKEAAEREEEQHTGPSRVVTVIFRVFMSVFQYLGVANGMHTRDESVRI